MRDSIEREITIKAAIETVWRVVTQPEHIAKWFGAETQLELRPGGEGTFTWEFGKAPLWVVKVEEPYHFAYRWLSPDNKEADADNSILVEFNLSKEGEHTKLQIVESGWNELSWSEKEKTAYAEDHAQGWSGFVSKIQAYAESL